MINISDFSEDLLGRQPFAEQLERFISVEHEYVAGSLVIALSASFGSGKSTFLSMWKESLSKKEDGEKPLVINLNAWESDYYGDPLFAIISAIIETVDSTDESPAKLVEAAKDFGNFVTAIGNQVAKKFSGIDAIAAGKHAQEKKEQRAITEELAPDSFSLFQDRKNAMRALKDAIQDFVSNCDSQVLFLVDELDRCRPDYAISYLETIKHIFDVKNAVFLLAADRHQLECSAKTAFGADLNFDEYYRKFIHREITLPKLDEQNYGLIAQKYVHHYLCGHGNRNCSMAFQQDQLNNITELITALKLTPRQLQEVFRVMGHIFESPSATPGKIYWCLEAGTILLTSLKIGDNETYQGICSKRISPNDMFIYLTAHLKLKNSNWWFMLLLTGEGLSTAPNANKLKILQKLNFKTEFNEEPTDRYIAQWASGWGHGRSNSLQIIHEKIENLSRWDI